MVAQLAQPRHGGGERIRRLLVQRPALMLGIVLSMGLLLGSAGAGIVLARGSSDMVEGVELERAGSDSAGSGARERADGGGQTADEDEDASVVVDVAGAVANPSVVELKAGARVQDAITAAGGVTAEADVNALNRAIVCEDGQKIYVPRQGETPMPAGGQSVAGAGSAGAESALVNINTADEKALDALPGVGPSTAQAIIEDREANGAFSSIEDLMRVSGIGEKKFEKLKSGICV